ncbi:prephenate-dependent tRNA uridine(34) hydroxylase TrhP [Halovibrio salipaludis]|nr:tRNA 5-hydroxyuridine modification protein YegQ [Halovibrio salipaludis]
MEIKEPLRPLSYPARMMEQAPELLAPVGNRRHLEMAIAYGADAVYAGPPRYSLRVRNNSFRDAEALAEAIRYTHAHGRRFYLVLNIAPHNDKIRSALRDLEPLIATGPDALIMSDPGLIMLVREHWPDMPIHLSVQANAVNWATLEFWRRQGLERVILSRELSLDEIEAMRGQVPGMELEVFVHGALCMAYSGRCLLSGYMNHRDANQGACTNACRWSYTPQASTHDSSGDLIPLHQEDGERSMLVEEAGRPGESVPMHEDEHGTYIMNSKDLRAVQHVERLCRMGVDSLKIEGRTKSPYYVARTVQVYRRAIDDAMAGRAFDRTLMDELEALSNRGYTEGFLRRHPPAEYQRYEAGTSLLGTRQWVGEVIAREGDWLCIEAKNRFECGDWLELMTPSGNHWFQPTTLLSERDHQTVPSAPGSGHRVWLQAPVADVLPATALLIRSVV